MHSYLKPIPKSGKDYPHNAEYHGEADGMDHGQEACSGPRKETSSTPKPGRVMSREKSFGKRIQIRIR